MCPAAINSNIDESTNIRPKHLENTGYLVDRKSIDTLKQIYASGMDPVVLANWLKKGIEEEVPVKEEKKTGNNKKESTKNKRGK